MDPCEEDTHIGIKIVARRRINPQNNSVTVIRNRWKVIVQISRTSNTTSLVVIATCLCYQVASSGDNNYPVAKVYVWPRGKCQVV
jgi:hypothetical protein